MLKEELGTGEALKAPAALTTRAKRESQLNDKKRGPKAIRESDQPIVVRSPLVYTRLKRAKELTC